MPISKKSLAVAVRNVAQHGDTDVFPYPLENHWFQDDEDVVIGILEAIDDISHVCRVNPWVGTYLEEHLEELCGAASGMSAVEVLAAIVEYCSESQDGYRTG